MTFNSQPAVDKIVRHKCYTSCQFSRIMCDSLAKDINLMHEGQFLSPDSQSGQIVLSHIVNNKNSIQFPERWLCVLIKSKHAKTVIFWIALEAKFESLLKIVRNVGHMTRQKSHTFDSEKVGKYKVSPTKWHASHTHREMYIEGTKLQIECPQTQSHPRTKAVSIKHGLRTEYKIRTRYKTRTGKHGQGIKQTVDCGLGIKYGLRTTLVKTVLIGS